MKNTAPQSNDFRWFIFVFWGDDLFFFEDDEPLKLYGPNDTMNEALMDLDRHLRGVLVDYWELPAERLMTMEVDGWN